MSLLYFVVCVVCTMSSIRKFMFAVSSPDEFVVFDGIYQCSTSRCPFWCLDAVMCDVMLVVR